LNSKSSFPKIPVAALIQEAYDLSVIAQKDFTELSKNGLTKRSLKELDSLFEKCKRFETLWCIAKQDSKFEYVELREFTAKCKKIRGDLHKNLAFVLKRDGKELPGVSRKNARPEIIQDLFDIAQIAETIIANQKSISLSSSLVEKARKNGKALSKLDAVVTNNQCLKKELKGKRDNSAHELASLIATIRITGKAAFADNPLRAKAYASSYHRQTRGSNQRRNAPY
jgi:hypothetical protein